MSIESEDDLRALRRVGRVVREALDAMKAAVRPGAATAELDRVGGAALARRGARSAPKLVLGFPGETCISVNDEAVHGVPGGRVLRPGDLVTLDVTAELDGYMADAAETVVVPPASKTARRLEACARLAFFRGMRAARPGGRTRDVGRAVEAEVRRHGFAVMRELTGHGIGRTIHEAPTVPNHDDPRCRDRLTEGLVLTIEPIVSERPTRTAHGDDGWTLRAADGGLTAHYEQTLVIRRGRPLLLTA